jgi:hypothetical protein
MVKDNSNSTYLFRYFLAFLLVIWSFIHFVFIKSPEPLLSSPTAFEWPAVDMMVYFERAINPNFLSNDFFTNTSHELSPRMIFGEIVMYFTTWFHADYYTIFYTLKAFLKIFMPVTLFLFLCSIPLGIEKDERKVAIKDLLLFCWAVVAPTWWAAAVFSVANWRPLPIWAAPQSLGLFFAFIGGTLLLNGQRLNLLLAILLLIAAMLIHPAMGVFMICFLILSSTSKQQFSRMSVLGVGIACVATFILQHYFTSSFKLPNTVFIMNYVIEPYIHRAHYAPESFGAYSSWPWREIAQMITGLLFTGFFISFIAKQYRLAWLGFVYIVAYWMAIAAQIIFINYIPMREIAILGPIRFTQFGYYMVALISSGTIAYFLAKWLPHSFFNIRHLTRTSQYVLLCVLICAGVLLTLFSLKWKDDPKAILYNKHPAMYNWIQQHTKITDVFTVPLSDSELFISIPIVGKRAVYYANAIAFSDQYLEENTIRKNFLYGSYTEWREGGPGGFYCRILTGERLKAAAKKYALQWAILPNECVDKRFNHLKLRFHDKRLSIFQID